MRFAPIKLIASDLDGTMLDSYGKIPEKNRLAVAGAISAGVTVTIATGRMYGSAELFAKQLGVKNVPLICYNGAVMRGDDGNTPVSLKLDLSVAREILAIFRERGIYVQSYMDETLYVRDGGHEDALYYQRRFGIRFIEAGDQIFDPRSEPTKLLAKTGGLSESRALIRELSERFAGNVYVTSSSEKYVEIMNPLAGKGRCVIKLAAMLGIPMENVMTIGDNDNDIEMISAAGVGIAMGNALDSVKSIAFDVAPSNDECGLAWAVNEYALRQA